MGSNPANIQIGDGLAGSLNNLGLLLSDAGRSDEAEPAYRRSAQIREALWAANPNHLDIKAGYAGSLCCLERWNEAHQFVEEVLAVLPSHPYANQVKRHVESRRTARE